MAKMETELFHHFKGTTTTVCLIQMRNGFCHVGQSSAANETEFDEEIGRQEAKKDAIAKAIEAEVYLAKELKYRAPANREVLEYLKSLQALGIDA